MTTGRWLAVCLGCCCIALVQAAPASQWWLSAGVFRTDAAAEAQLAALTKQGVTLARVVDARRGGELLHRIVIGPYADSTAAHGALSDLRRFVTDAFALQLDLSPQVQADAASLPRTSPAPDAASVPAVEGARGPAHDADVPPRVPEARGELPSVAEAPAEPVDIHRGITVQEYLRRNGGNTPTAPAEAPPGFQLNRLHRSNGTTVVGDADDENIHDITPDVTHASGGRTGQRSASSEPSAHQGFGDWAAVRWVRRFFAAIWDFIAV